MKLLSLFYPYEYAESVFVIDYEKLYAMGYRGLLFDIDNTLVPHGKDSTPEVDALLQRLQALGFGVLMLSNNDDERILRFLKNVDAPFISEADKPLTKGYLRALDVLGIKKEEAICIGDQVFTDVLGANRCGMASILVKFIHPAGDRKIGKRRRAEQLILLTYRLRKKYTRRLGGIDRKGDGAEKPAAQPRRRKQFCELGPTCYKIALQKEILRRHVQDLLCRDTFAKQTGGEKLPVLIAEYHSYQIKTGPGIDPVLQRNKLENIRIAAAKMNGTTIHPGEVFSFWRLVGKVTKRKGYRDGRVLVETKLQAGLGGGLCNLVNTLHLLVMHSPLEVTEFHSHSDALAPDHDGVHVPFSAGTSISYNSVDYRFRNCTDQDIQLLLWVEGEELYGELRGEKEIPTRYTLTEEDHHFRKEGEKYFRISKIYRNTIDKATGELLKKELVLDNHSEVLFDYSLIPPEQIRQ